MNKPDFQDPDIAPHRTMGTPIELHQPRGERGKEGRRDRNESAVEGLYERQLIGIPEMEAAAEYHRLVYVASGADMSAPDLERVRSPSRDGVSFNKLEAIQRLTNINKKLPRVFRTVLMFAFHPQTHGTLAELDKNMGYPERMMHGRLMLIEALREIAVIMGYANENSR